MAGRHRKPTHTGRNLAVVGAAVSVSGAFLVPSAEARAAEPVRANSTGSSGILDAIAQCESSGNPNASNGTHFGLFQFDLPTYRSVGGTGDPRDDSVAEQYRRAAALLAARGTQPWNASKHCWSGKVGSAPRVARSEAPARQSAPSATKRKTAPKAAPKGSAKGVTGKRGPDGTGSYVCTPDKLFFDACDPGTLGQVVNYPLYDGRHRATPATAARPAAVPVPPGASASKVVAAALGYRGVPYVWGGTTRNGMDCSGLVWTVLRDLGLNPPRTSAAQYAWTRRISAGEARPGDLVFHYSPVSHVGIYLGDGKMIDASQPGTRISVHTVYPGAKYGRIPG